MNLKSNKLSTAVRVALSVGAMVALGTSGNVFAQDAATNDASDATKLQAVMVTGSHIRRVDMETASPVITVGQEEIKASGALTLGDLVQDLPAMTGGMTNPQVNNGGGEGSTSISLRGLGPDRTLILVNGHRVLSGDVNSIPANMIARIDVLTDGASAVYGSDAIGGVVNFITKTHYKGMQLTANYGQSSRADGRSQGYTLTLGSMGDKGGFIAGIGYSKMEGVEAANRAFSENSVSIGGPANNLQTYIGGSSNSPYGHIGIPATGPVAAAFAGCASGALARNPGASGMDPINDYHCYQNSGANSDKYNYATVNLIMTPQQHTNGFILSHYDLNDDVTVYFNAYYNKTRSNFQLAPATYHVGHGVDISKDNYYNPFGTDFNPMGSQFNSRLETIGSRIADFGTTLFQGSLGIKGDFMLFDNRWDWDVGMDYGHLSRVETTSGLPNLNKLYTGPSFMDTDGVVKCGTPGDVISGCDASFNPFNMQSPNSVAALKKAAVPALTNTYQQQRVYHANVNGGLFNLPAGTVQLALGLNYRTEHLVSRVDPVLTRNPETGSCVLGSMCSSGMRGGYNVKEAYAEVFIPVLAGRPGAEALNVIIGDRYSKFSTFGSTNNTSFKVEWRPIHALLVRGTVAEVFRAPNISEVFGAPGSDSPKMNFDPCDGYTGNPVNPACVNVPTDGSFVNQNVAQNLQAATTTAGSAYAGFPIKPEKGKSFDLGLVYSPSWLPGFSGSVDFWHLYLKDIITSVGLQSLVNLCSAGQLVYCQYIHRYPSGPQQGQISTLTVEPTGNLGRVDVSGVDTSLTYKLNTTSAGRFRFVVNATYLKYYDQQSAPGTNANVTYHDAGHFLSYGSPQAAACPGASVCLFPRLRGNANIHWQMGNWSAAWKIHYIGDFRMGSAAPSQDVHPTGSAYDGVYFDYGSTFYHDVTVGYDIKAIHTRVDVGVRNAFDNQPPVMWANNTLNANTAPSSFDLMGRYYWARLTFSFQ
ncbi:MAG TPA: TonB-dependent receptor [Oleiagrimonas sp.]|nr:TonB-dependent receptor [Oleiagrimonas sp.]